MSIVNWISWLVEFQHYFDASGFFCPDEDAAASWYEAGMSPPEAARIILESWGGTQTY